MNENLKNPISYYGIVVTAADVMNPNVVSVRKDAPIYEVVEIFKKYDFVGIPVVSEKNVLVGLITQFDLVVKESGFHIPTLLKIFEEIKVSPLEQERLILEDILKPIRRLRAKDIMNENPLFLYADAPLEEILNKFAQYHRLSPIVVVDNAKRVLGVIGRHDLIKILALKELGKEINEIAPYNLQQSEKSAPLKISEALNKIKEGFYFFPKHKATKWIVFALSLFIIGFLSSILFVAKIPDFSPKVVEEKSQVPIGKGAILSLRVDKNSYALGEKIPLKISIKSGDILFIKEVHLSLKFDPAMVVINEKVRNLNSSWNLALQMVNLEDNSLILSWVTDNPQLVSNNYLDLGEVKFQTLQKGKIVFYPDFKSSRQEEGSVVKNATGQNLLDNAEKVSVEVL